MTLANDFQFSQASLQDYEDCPRRFQLRYVQRVAWPAPEADPALENEHYLRRGAAFHRLVHQHALGLPLDRLSNAVPDDLQPWWRNYLDHGPPNLPDDRYPEVLLSAPAGDYRLLAKYDLVAIDPARRAIIVDWKTSRKRTPHKWLAQRLQTRVYPYLLVRAGAHLNAGQSFAPEQVEMIYWFADFPTNPERFTYDEAQFRKDEIDLTTRIGEIAGRDDAVWPLTPHERRCNYCPYRSLCQRGVRAGPLDEIEEIPEP
ncbi:MAG: PD-(D/E)XK nuclease family protein, partial [bacterium]|nr:PD-(D/E)XK nuclease family protein [bacterium]